jgi:cobalt/nickel transport protein
VTQVVKTGPQGIFTFAMPWPGWWGFAALHTDDAKLKHRGEEKDVEVGGVIWVKAD